MCVCCSSQLQELTVGHSQHMTGSSMAALPQHCSLLQVLCVEHLPCFSSNYLTHLRGLKVRSHEKAEAIYDGDVS